MNRKGLIHDAKRNRRNNKADARGAARGDVRAASNDANREMGLPDDEDWGDK